MHSMHRPNVRFYFNFVTPTSYLTESFLNLLNHERNRRGIYKTRAQARQDVFDYIEMFYNPKRKHANNGKLSPVKFEQQQKLNPQGV